MGGMMNKRGISPLIATVFLIAVAVSLGSIVMSLGQEYVSQAPASPASCSSLRYDVKSINSGVDLEIAIDNQNGAIDGFLIKMFNRDFTKGYTERVSQRVEEFDVAIVRLTVDTSRIDKVYEVQIIPQILSSGEFVPCTQKLKTITADSSLFRQ